MNYWLMKSEPTAYSIDDLMQRPKRMDYWDGVRNYQARNFMRDHMQIGDQAFFYHSNCPIPGIVGVMEIVQASSADLSAFDATSQYFDPKSRPEQPRWFMVQVQFLEKFHKPLPLTVLKTDAPLARMLLLRPGNRLSVMPIQAHEWQRIMALAKGS